MRRALLLLFIALRGMASAQVIQPGTGTGVYYVLGDGGTDLVLCTGERYRINLEATQSNDWPLAPFVNTNVATPRGAIVWTQGSPFDFHSWCPPERLRKIGEKQARRRARGRR